MTDCTTHTVPPYTSKDDFLAHGLDATTLQQSINCSICHEPLLMKTAIDAGQVCRIDQSLPRVPAHDGSTSTSLEELVPEVPVRIRHCRHIFGRTCLTTWFDTTASPHRCPECAVILFPASRIHIALCRPTHAERLQFADAVEYVLHDAEGANEIREELMGERTAFMMRELTLEILRQQGWEVTWEYVGEGDDEEQEQAGSPGEDHGAEIADEELEGEEEGGDQQSGQDSE